MKSKVAAALGAAVATIAISGCGSAKSEGVGVPTLSGSDASLTAQVDCGDDGVTDVHVTYGKVDTHVLIGKNPLTQAVGGSATFDNNYGIGANDSNVSFTITTSPTRGTCKTTLTNYNTGDVIAEKTSAGKAELKALFTGKG